MRTPRSPLRVVNAAGQPSRIYLYEEIGIGGVTADDVRDALQAATADRIEFHINSPGGDIFEAIAIFNLIRSRRTTITSHVDSVALSAASVVALAARRVVMARHSQMMIHDAWGLVAGDASVMRSASARLEQQSDNIAGIYAERGRGRSHWRKLMREETWFTAEEAVSAGLADEVGAISAVKNQWDLSAFRNAPRASDAEPEAVNQERLRFERFRSRQLGVA